jgi:hypothetical protein
MVTGAEVRTGKPVPNPQMRVTGVSVVIVVRARESRVQGEGLQLERVVRGNPAGCEGWGIPADADRAPRTVIPSQAVAVCGESRMHGNNGGIGRHSSAVSPVPTHSMVPQVRARLRQSAASPAASPRRQMALGNVPDATDKNVLVSPQSLAADAEPSEGWHHKGARNGRPPPLL